MTASLPEPDDHDPDEWESSAQLPHVHGWIPFTDAALRTILEAAVLDLVTHRGGCDDDASVAISVLVSLLAEGECWLPELVADARDQSYSWDLIAERLGTTIAFTKSVGDAFIISGG